MSLEPLHGLLAATDAPADEPLVGASVVTDTDLPDIAEPALPLAVTVTGGAGQIAGPAGLCARRGWPLASLTTSLRDLDDLAGNARRVVAAVDAARAEGVLADDVTIRVALPAEPPSHGWLAAADEVAAMEWQLALPRSIHGDLVPDPVIAAWIDAALDRETPYAVLGVTEARQALAVLTATAAAWDGAAGDQVAAALAGVSPDPDTLATGRRWCRSVEVLDGAAVADGIRHLIG